MSQQYLRNLSLIVAPTGGNGIELGALRVVFEVRRGDTQTPNTCDCRVYNLSANTMAQLQGRGTAAEFTQLRLSVSYGDSPLSQIFYGSIKQVRTGREDQKNSYIAITAADGDEVYNFAPLAFTLAAGSTVEGSVENLLAVGASSAFWTQEGAAFTQRIVAAKIVKGYVTQTDTNSRTRGRVYFGSWRDEMRELAASQSCKWNIQDGALNLYPATGYIPCAPVLITPSTGLIGVPEQTQNGLAVRVLLNPAIKIGQTIKLDSSDINQLRFGVDNQSIKENLALKQGAAKLNGDGLYYVMKVDHFGDTRGTAWYSDLTCLAVDATVTPPSSVAQATVSPADAIPRY